MQNEYEAQDRDVRKRLDHYLLERGLDYSRSQVKKWIEAGQVLVNGLPTRGAYRLKEGDRISLTIPEPQPLPLQPEEIPLSILFEDKDLLVLDKPAGLVVHPAPGHRAGTLVHALLAHCRELSGIGGVLRPGIVHRLDKDTSGLMIVAKNDYSHRALVRQFQSAQVTKEYQALVWGHPAQDKGVINQPIGRHPIHRKKMAVNPINGKPAVTEWTVLERFPCSLSRLKLNIKTGRTHQIRVHLSWLGYPVVGDPLYGRAKGPGKDLAGPLADALKAVSRQLLHSSFLSFKHPVSETPMAFSSPLPADMQGLIDLLKSLPG